MARSTVVGIKVEGLREVKALLRALPAEASAELKDAAGRIAVRIGSEVVAAAASSAQRAAVARTVATRKGITPTVALGGKRKIVSGGGTAGDLLFGAEFGGRRRPTTRQFARHRGTHGWFIYPTLRRLAPEQVSELARAADAIVDRWRA